MTADIGREPEAYLREKVAIKEISPTDADIILQFVNEQVAVKGVKPHTAASNTRYIAKAVKYCPNVKTWTLDKLYKYVTYVRGHYKVNTHRKDILTTRTFVLWLIDEKILTGVDRAKVEKIEAPPADRMTKKAADMLTGDEVTTLIQSTKNSRDRAMLAMLFEGAFRPIELLSLTWGDVLTDQYGCVVNTNKKTGKPRRIRLILSAQYLNAWRNDYPASIKGDSPIFVNRDTTSATNLHAVTRAALKKVFNKAKVAIPGKRIHPYLFRHSRITEMISQGVPESVVKLQGWGSLSTPMIATYTHLTGEQEDTFLLAAAGKEKAPEKKKDGTLNPRKCPGCGKDNLPGMEFCGTCGAILDPAKYQEHIAAGASEIEQLKAQMQQMQKYMQELQQFHGQIVAESLMR